MEMGKMVLYLSFYPGRVPGMLEASLGKAERHKMHGV